MTVRTRYKLTVGISSNPANEERDLGNLGFEVVDDSQGEGGTTKITIAAAAVDVPVQLTQVASGAFLMLRTNAKDATLTPSPISVKKNATVGEAWTVTPLGTAREGHFVVSTAGITALYLSNNAVGAVAMEVTIAMSGD